jgi:aspartate aminotransferase
MELADRVQELTPSLTLAVSAKAKQMVAEGQNVIGFGAGEPDFDTPEHIKVAAMGSLDAGFTKYTPAAGIMELREAIADKLREENLIDYTPEQITVSCGAKHACMTSLSRPAFNPGDEVLIPAPYWTELPRNGRLWPVANPSSCPPPPENGYKLEPGPVPGDT